MSVKTSLVTAILVDDDGNVEKRVKIEVPDDVGCILYRLNGNVRCSSQRGRYLDGVAF